MADNNPSHREEFFSLYCECQNTDEANSCGALSVLDQEAINKFYFN